MTKRVEIRLYDVSGQDMTAWVHNELPYWLAEWLMKQPNLNAQYTYRIEVRADSGHPVKVAHLPPGLPIPVAVHRIMTEWGY